MENSIFPNPCTYVKESISKIIPQMEHVKIDEKSLKNFVLNLLKDKNALKFPKWCESHFDATSVPFETLLRYLFVIDTLNYCFWRSLLLDVPGLRDLMIQIMDLNIIM